MIARTPPAPYYAVIFTSIKKSETPGYEEMARLMMHLAEQQDGFLGVESAREEVGITVSYWSSLEAIKIWKENSRHLVAQKLGKEEWYTSYKTRICMVQRDYSF